jgi:hypothetical protein
LLGPDSGYEHGGGGHWVGAASFLRHLEMNMIWLEFMLCATLIVAAAVVLSHYSDVLAEKTGLGRVWVGAILPAGQGAEV